MRNAVFDVGLPCLHEPMLHIKLFKPRLCAYAYGLHTRVLKYAGQGLTHQLVAYATSTHRLADDHAPYAGFRKLHADCKTARISHKLAIGRAKNMHSLKVRTIHVLIDASLFHHENFRAKLQGFIEFSDG